MQRIATASIVRCSSVPHATESRPSASASRLKLLAIEAAEREDETSGNTKKLSHSIGGRARSHALVNALDKRCPNDTELSSVVPGLLPAMLCISFLES